MTVRYRIHPAIGAARMGNSPEHFIGPETPSVAGNWDDAAQKFKSFRDSSGRVLRQGARFRVFEYTFDGSGNISETTEVVIGGKIVNIEWRVHLANRKASFFAFHGQSGAEDTYKTRKNLPASQIIPDSDPQRTNLRNAAVADVDRVNQLDIDPGERSIDQHNSGPVELTNDKPNIPIKSLGTLLLDEKGRLIVLGGYGGSSSTASPPKQIDDYASNDTWFDDASDGSIKALIHFDDGTTMDADPAWLLVGPPKFAPGIGNVVTLHDTVWDVAVRGVDVPASTPLTANLTKILDQKKAWAASGGKTLAGFKPSFLNDIYPILKRALGARDVHQSTDLHRNYHRTQLPQWAKLSGPDDDGLRGSIFGWMRDPDASTVDWKKMPRGLGDDYTALDNDELNPTPQSFLSLTRIQYAMLREWSKGNFVNDWTGTEPTFSTNLNPTPDDLDKASIENCVGGPFFPGIEVSWLIRTKELYSEPFRLKSIDEASTTSKIGALDFRPGFFSQQMALPWQADFYDCHKEEHYDPDGNQYYFMWWTAQRPDDVYPSGGAEQLPWVRSFGITNEATDNNRFTQMQQRWFELKFIAVKNGDHYEEEL